MKFKIGELVKWYELYGDVYIVKDQGLGMIVSQTQFYDSKIFKVHRIKHNDCVFFEAANLQKNQ